MTTIVETPRIVGATVTANGALAAGRHTPVNASGGARTMTLPTAVTPGSHLSVEKTDTSSNPVAITGVIRGATSSISLVLQYESVTFTADAAGTSWWPTAGHKTKTSLDALYQGKPSTGTASSATFLRGDGAWATPATGSGGATLLAGTGIDPTGATDSAAAVQAILTAATDGTTIVVPDGAVIRCNSGLTIAHRIKFGGTGTINFYNLTGSGHSAGVTVTANGANLIGLNIGNPSMATPDNTYANGNSQYGILIAANDVLVAGCTVDKFQSGIVVDTHGEYYRTRIMYNRVSDVLGAGGGASDTTSQLGEDRGDGICNWGAQATIVGNIVNCIAGGDARIGIHTEALPGQETTGGAYADSSVTISDNIVYGQFRRGIVSEEVARTSIVGNSVSDATWWGIALISAQDCTISGNTVNWTRTSTDNQGGSWSPVRSAIMLWASSSVLQDAIVTGNTIHIAAGATISDAIAGSGGWSTFTSENFRNCIVEGNTIRDESNTLAGGIRFRRGSTGLRIANNTVYPFQSWGVYLESAVDCLIAGNRVTGPGQSVSGTKGIAFNDPISGAQITANTVTDCDIGIAPYNGTEVMVSNNRVTRANTGINGFTGTAPWLLVGNLISTTVTTPFSNIPSTAIQAGNSN